MSLDVDLRLPRQPGPERWAIFIREDGCTKEITLEEWNKRYPGERPCLALVGGHGSIYSANITHNLGPMADAVDIYKPLWRPEEVGITKAAQLIEPLTQALNRLKAMPETYRKHNAVNGWGTYENFVPFVENYLAACIEYPDADIAVDR